MKIYQRVQMKQDTYAADGIHTRELYNDIAYKAAFSHPDGTTYALQAIRCEDLTDAEENGGNPL